MKRRFTKEQTIQAVKKMESGFSAKDLSRETGVTQTTLYHWRRKFSGMDVSGGETAERTGSRKYEVKTNRSRSGAGYIDAQGCELEKVVGPNQKRAEVLYLLGKYRKSKVRVSGLLGLSISSLDYKKHPRSDEPVRSQLIKLSSDHRRFGHQVLLVQILQGARKPQ